MNRLRTSVWFLSTCSIVLSCTPKNNEVKSRTEAHSAQNQDHQSFKIYNGTDGQPSGTGYYRGSTWQNACSATEVVKSRCILTARHCDPARFGTVPYEVYGQNSTVTAGNKEAPVIRKKKFGTIPGTAVQADLMLLWVADKYYNSDTGYNGTGSPTFDPKSLSLPPAVNSLVTIAGYGNSGGGAGIGTSRTGTMKVSSITDVPASSSDEQGQYMVLVPAGTPPQNTCNGDSGGGAFNADDKIVGVISQSSSGGCGSSPAPAPTSNDLYTNATSFGNETLTWLNQNIDSFCRPKVNVRAKSTGYPSKVIGVDFKTQQTVINCDEGGPNDLCYVSQSINDIVLTTSTSDSDLEFVKWEGQGANLPSCPCEGSTNPQCTVGHDFLNYKTPGPNLETAVCIAEYRRKPSPTPSTSPTPAPTMPSGDPTPATSPTPTPTPTPTTTMPSGDPTPVTSPTSTPTPNPSP